MERGQLEPGSHQTGDNVLVGARALGQAEAPCERQRTLVVVLARQATVGDLERIELGCQTLEQRFRWDRMVGIERVRDVDERSLLADRIDGVGERHARRHVLLEVDADHLALLTRLDLAGDGDVHRRAV